jgi:hypothetical protein
MTESGEGWRRVYAPGPPRADGSFAVWTRRGNCTIADLPFGLRRPGANEVKVLGDGPLVRGSWARWGRESPSNEARSVRSGFAQDVQDDSARHGAP